MRNIGLARRVVVAAFAVAMVPLWGCGAGDPMSGHQLQSITIAPATATAQGQAVQFTATGYWSGSPATVTPQSAYWGACVEQVSGNTVNEQTTTEVTVSSSGMAQCASGAKGTFTVFAYDPPLGTPARPECNVLSACGGGCTISGTAQLTCP